jgi:Flp pilus assembly protein TadD
VLVDIKAYGRKVDNYLIEALEYLQDRKGAAPQWAEMLGKIYFQKGDVQRSLSIFSSVIKGDTRNVSVGTLILAAEAARRNSKMKKAVSILESAYDAMPEQVPVLNNLVYLLAQDPGTLSRAQALVPKLKKLGGDSFAVMDTIAMVYLRSGDIENARVWMDKAMSSLKKDSYSTPEVRLNAAEIQMRSGDYQKARSIIGELRQDYSRTDYIDQKARTLLHEIDSLKDGI